MRSAFPIHLPNINQLEIDLVNKGGGFECLSGAFPFCEAGGHTTQFFVDMRRESIEGARVALCPIEKKLSGFRHFQFHDLLAHDSAKKIQPGDYGFCGKSSRCKSSGDCASKDDRQSEGKEAYFMKCLRITLLGAATLLSLALNGNAQNMVTNWNTIASTAIVTTGGVGPGASSVWFAYTNIAIYDAVNAVHGRKFEPFYYSGRAASGASDQAAALAAAHRVLVSYFPLQQSALDAQYQASLMAITDTARAKAEGVKVGEAAAEALISERTGDGLNAPITYSEPSAPGVWQPNPAGSTPVTPWLGQMRPFTMRSADQFLPDGPTPLTSEEWVADFNLTRLFGSSYSDVRTAGQKEIGLFWTAHTGAQYSQTFNALAQHYNLDLLDSARLMAMLWTGYADAAIGCFNGKYTYNFWRPWGAIPVGGGNSEAVAEPNWTPLATTPNHPEYPAAHACITGAVSSLVADYFHTRKVHVVVTSSAFTGQAPHTHVFEDTGDWLTEVYWARIFAGFHFNHSLQDGAQLGRQVAEQLFENHFRVEGERDRH